MIILAPSYNGAIPIKIAIFLVALQLMLAFPLCVKPAKDSFNDIFFPKIKQGQDSTKHHFLAVLGICLVSMGIGMFVPRASDALTLLGATMNPHSILIDYFIYIFKIK